MTKFVCNDCYDYGHTFLNKWSCLARALCVTKFTNFKYTVVLLITLVFYKPPMASEAGSLNKSLCSAAAVGVTKFIVMVTSNLVKYCYAT